MAEAYPQPNSSGYQGIPGVSTAADLIALWKKPALKLDQFHIDINSYTVQMVSRMLPKYDVPEGKAVPKEADKLDKSKPLKANQWAKLVNCAGHFNEMALGVQRFLKHTFQRSLDYVG